MITDAATLAIGGGLTVSIAYFLIKPDIQTYFRLRFSGLKKEDGSNGRLTGNFCFIIMKYT